MLRKNTEPVAREARTGLSTALVPSNERGGGVTVTNGRAVCGRGEVAIDSMAILDRVSKALANGKPGLTYEERIEVEVALNDIAVRLERAAGVVPQLTQLRGPAATLKTVDLTEREVEILGHVADGKTNREIAAHCSISNNTVKFHVKNLFRKLEVRNRGQAMLIARGVGLTINPAA
jgi:DNA-binding NarL/FixJ family response regulator